MESRTGLVVSTAKPREWVGVLFSGSPNSTARRGLRQGSQPSKSTPTHSLGFVLFRHAYAKVAYNFHLVTELLCPTKAITPHKARRRGFMLLELMIALVLSGFILSTMFFAWRYISKHTITQQKKSLFQVEADRIVQSIAQQIRRSPEVVKMTSNGITFLSPGGRDTIVYEFTNGSFRKNNVEVWNDERSAWITQFSIEKENSELGIDTSSSITILLTVGLQDRFGNSSVFPLKVRAAIFPERFNTEMGGARGWNF